MPNITEPVERDPIESCKSAPVAVEARRKHGSETKALLQVLSKDHTDQPVFTVFSFLKMFGNVLKTETFRIKIKCYPLHIPHNQILLLSRGYRGYPSTKSFVEVQVYGIRKQSLFKTNGQCLVDSCWISF